MKQITVLIDRGDGWKPLHKGPERIKVVLAPQDREASQIAGYVFDPEAPERVPESWGEKAA